jgi:hypothetical protein
VLHLQEAHHFDGGTHISASTRMGDKIKLSAKKEIISFVKTGGNSLGEQPLP